MYKYSIIVALALSGCSQFTVTGTICDQVASEPNSVMPAECRVYSEEKAEKAFDKVVDEQKISDKDLEFHKEE